MWLAKIVRSFGICPQSGGPTNGNVTITGNGGQIIGGGGVGAEVAIVDGAGNRLVLRRNCQCTFNRRVRGEVHGRNEWVFDFGYMQRPMDLGAGFKTLTTEQNARYDMG